MVEYSKNLFTCKVLDAQVIDGKYRVVDGVIYFHDQIYLTRDSKLKKKILHATYEALSSGHVDLLSIITGILLGGSQIRCAPTYQEICSLFDV